MASADWVLLTCSGRPSGARQIVHCGNVQSMQQLDCHCVMEVHSIVTWWFDCQQGLQPDLLEDTAYYLHIAIMPVWQTETDYVSQQTG